MKLDTQKISELKDKYEKNIQNEAHKDEKINTPTHRKQCKKHRGTSEKF